MTEDVPAPAVRETPDRLQVENKDLRASRERLVLAADADRRELERELHEGVQQHLIVLAVNLQLAAGSVEIDAVATKERLDELARVAQEALDDAGRLAHRIYAPLLDTGGLAAELRAAAVMAGVPASVEVSAEGGYGSEVARTVYLCWLEALAESGTDSPAAISVRQEAGAIVFEIGRPAHSDTGLDRLRDRVEALGGLLTVAAETEGRATVTGSLPLTR
jgi:signal transduction histidine kinase